MSCAAWSAAGWAVSVVAGMFRSMTCDAVQSSLTHTLALWRGWYSSSLTANPGSLPLHHRRQWRRRGLGWHWCGSARARRGLC